jgi:hypothetical protein
MSPAESDELKRNSFVLPLTSIKRKFIWNKKNQIIFLSMLPVVIE